MLRRTQICVSAIWTARARARENAIDHRLSVSVHRSINSFNIVNCPHVRCMRRFHRRTTGARLPAVPVSRNNLGQVAHTHVTKQYNLVPCQGAAMPCGWEGNRRSGVALAIRHRLQWFIHLRPRQGDEHPAYAVLWSMAHLPYLSLRTIYESCIRYCTCSPTRIWRHRSG